MAFLDLKNAVIRLSPNQISTTLAGEVVNAAYKRVVRARNWTANHVYTTINLNGPYTTGTVTATKGSTTIVGVGTAWTSAITLNKSFQIGNSVPTRIAQFTSATSLDIDAYWGKPTVAGAAYRIIDNRFSLGTNVERVLGLSSESNDLMGSSTTALNKMDPSRVQRASPRFYAEFEYRQQAAVVGREIEVWPVPETDTMVNLWFKVLPFPLTGDADVPVLPETLIEYSAQAEGCRILFGRTGDQGWVTLGQTYEGLFKDALQAYMAEDMISQSEPPAPQQAGAPA